MKYSNGDKVFYRRKNVRAWKGTGVVLGKDGQFVLIRHGEAYYCVHLCQLMKEKVVHEQEHIKNGLCKDSSSSHGVDKTEEGNGITFEGDVRDDISDNVPGPVQDNLSECTDNEDNATKGVATDDVENNAVQAVTPENRTSSVSQWKVVSGSMQKYSVYN